MSVHDVVPFGFVPSGFVPSGFVPSGFVPFGASANIILPKLSSFVNTFFEKILIFFKK